MKKGLIKIILSFSFVMCLSMVSMSSIFAAKEASKSTDYGTLSGFISPYNSGNVKYCEGGTFIDTPVTQIKVKIEAKRTSTGADLGYTQNQYRNSTGVGDVLTLTGYTGTQVTFYGTHDAIHTKGYHVYTSTIY